MGIKSQSFVINGRLPSLNEYINAERTNRFQAAAMKKTLQARIQKEISAAGLRPVKGRVEITYRYFEKNRRRDLDNVAGMCHKVTQDALVEAGIIKDDGWKYVAGYTDRFELDKDSPRIEVTLREIGGAV